MSSPALPSNTVGVTHASFGPKGCFASPSSCDQSRSTTSNPLARAGSNPSRLTASAVRKWAARNLAYACPRGRGVTEIQDAEISILRGRCVNTRLEEPEEHEQQATHGGPRGE